VWLAGGAAMVAYAESRHSSAFARDAILVLSIAGLVAGFAIAFWPLQVALEADRGRLVVGKHEIREPRVEVGNWVIPGADVSLGVVAHVRGDGGAIAVGARGHMGDGLVFRARPVRVVDVQVAPNQLDQLLAALGIELARATPGSPLVVPLVRSSQNARGVLRMMTPWMLTILVITVGSIAVASSSFGLAHTNVMVLGIVVVVATGLTWTIVRAMRVREPDFELRVGERGLGLARPFGDEVSHTPWSEVRAERRSYRPSDWIGRPLPIIVLGLADRRIRIGCWSPEHAWSDDVARARAPAWLVGDAPWQRFVEALRDHRVIDAT
jgi:hypothetical protein